jgi:hypothetical protein
VKSSESYISLGPKSTKEKEEEELGLKIFTQWKVSQISKGVGKFLANS